jgi:hypothetical protein
MCTLYILSMQIPQVVPVMDTTLIKLYQEFESAVKALTGRTQARVFLNIFYFRYKKTMNSLIFRL